MGYLRLSIISIILLLATSCEKRLPFEAEQLDASLVVYAFMTEDSELFVQVTESRSTLSLEFAEEEAIAGCTLELYADDALIETTTSLTQEGYLLDAALEQGVSYRLEVSHPDYEPVSAMSRIPPKAAELTAELVDIDYFEAVVDITFTDVPEADHYLLLVFNESQYGGGLSGFSTRSEYFELDPIEGEAFFFDDGYFLDDLFENDRAELRVRANYFYDPNYGGGDDGIKIVLRSCSDEYFRFYRSRRAFFESNNGLFAEPVQIFTNIENGLGCFGGYSDIETLVQ